MTGLIADIQRSSVHDGPGIRTTVFFKGCPLSCKWCHNPECISKEPQELFYPQRCIGCGKCDEGCFTGAKSLCGKNYTEKELLEIILADKVYYGENGGVTFSGGEPLMQADFLFEAMKLCKKEGVGCAIETSLSIYDERVFKEADLVMADLKIWDEDTHKLYTGMTNERIKANFKKLASIGVPTLARTPVIPNIDQGIDKIAEFLRGLDNVFGYELLPYHPLGESKRAALGLDPCEEFSVPTKEFMKELEKYVFLRSKA